MSGWWPCAAPDRERHLRGGDGKRVAVDPPQPIDDIGRVGPEVRLMTCSREEQGPTAARGVADRCVRATNEHSGHEVAGQSLRREVRATGLAITCSDARLQHSTQLFGPPWNRTDTRSPLSKLPEGQVVGQVDPSRQRQLGRPSSDDDGTGVDHATQGRIS